MGGGPFRVQSLLQGQRHGPSRTGGPQAQPGRVVHAEGPAGSAIFATFHFWHLALPLPRCQGQQVLYLNSRSQVGICLLPLPVPFLLLPLCSAARCAPATPPAGSLDAGNVTIVLSALGTCAGRSQALPPPLPPPPPGLSVPLISPPFP